MYPGTVPEDSNEFRLLHRVILAGFLKRINQVVIQEPYRIQDCPLLQLSFPFLNFELPCLVTTSFCE